MNKTTRNELRKLIWAEQSWRSACALCELGMSLPEDESDINYSMMAGIAVPYARPFMRNDGFGPLPDTFKEFSSATLKENHERLLLMRNKIFGHNDDLWARSQLEGIERYYLNISETGALSSKVVGISSSPCQEILDLVYFQRDRCKARVQSLVEQHISLKPNFGIGSFEIKDDPPYIRSVEQIPIDSKSLARISTDSLDPVGVILKEGQV